MTAIAIEIVGTAITIRGALYKKCHDTIYKTVTKIVVKRFRATTFAIEILEESGIAI